MNRSFRDEVLVILSTLYSLVFVVLPVGCNKNEQSPVEAPSGLTISAPSYSTGEFIVTLSYPWPESGSSQDDYTLEESTISSTSRFVQIAASPEGAWHQTFSFPLNRQTGTYYYRARAWVNATPTAYSSVATVVVTSTDKVVTFYASYTNVLRYSSSDPTIANTVDISSDLSVGSNYYFGTTGSYDYNHSASLLGFNVQSMIALKTILEAKLRLYPRSLPRDSMGQYKLAATTIGWTHSTITWTKWFTLGKYYASITTDFAAPSTTDGPFEIDVTPIVQNWASGFWAAIGFVMWEPNLRPPDPPIELHQAATFESDDNYSNLSRRPQLFVRYK